MMDRRSWLKLSLSGTAALIMGAAPALQPRKIPPKGFRTGLAAIDDYTGCWDRGDLITFLGRSGSGKTAMGCQIAQINAKDGHKVAVLTDGSEFQWQMLCGVKKEWMPDSLANIGQFKAILEGLDADLIVLDAPIPYFYEKDYAGMGLQFHRHHAVAALARHCHEYQRSAIILLQTQHKPNVSNGYVIISDLGRPSLLHYTSSRIFRIQKLRELDLVDVSMVKNRTGFNHGSFYYKHVVSPSGVQMVPVPNITIWDSVIHDRQVD